MATSKIPTTSTSKPKHPPQAAIVRPTHSRASRQPTASIRPPKVPPSAFSSSSSSTTTSLAKTTLSSLRSPRATAIRSNIANPSVTVRKPPPVRLALASVPTSSKIKTSTSSPIEKQTQVATLEVLPSKQAELSSIHLDFTSLSDDVVTIRSLLEKVYQEVQGSNIIQERLIDENKKLKAELRILRDKMKSLQAIASPIDCELVIPEELEVFSDPGVRKGGPSLYYTPRK